MNNELAELRDPASHGKEEPTLENCPLTSDKQYVMPRLIFTHIRTHTSSERTVRSKRMSSHPCHESLVWQISFILPQA